MLFLLFFPMSSMCRIHSNVELRPGLHLNLIIGPNGSGKSTIVSAMCLGLGGSPNVLDRQKQIDSFIKIGEKKATIEIELQKHPENVVIKRVIEANGAKGTSSWFIDSKPTTMNDVLKMTKSLNIQIDNLCQFVPQERVSAFADLSPEDLLIATEEAIGGDAFVAEHKALIALGEEKTSMQTNKDDYTNRLAGLEAQHENGKADYERYLTRKERSNTVEILEQKLPWLEYERERIVYAAAKGEVETAKERKKAAQHAAGPAQSELEEVKRKKAAKVDELASIRSSLAQATKASDKISSTIEEKREKVDDLQQRIAGFGDQTKKYEVRIRKDQNVARENQELLENTNVDELKPKQKAVHEQLGTIKQNLLGVQREQRDIKEEKQEVLNKVKNTEQSLRGLSNQKQIAKKKLFAKDRHGNIQKACEWLGSNKDKFKQEVYDAVCLQIEMIKKEDAFIVESLIPVADLQAMLAQNREDHRTLLAEMERLKNKVTAFKDPHPQEARQANFTLKDLKEYGFRCMVTDLFNAPDPIMRYLRFTHNLHLIPVGDAGCEKHAKVLFDKFDIQRFIAGRNMCNVSRSDYGARNTNIRSSTLRDANLLGAAANDEQLRILKEDMKRYQEATAELENQERELNKQENVLREDEPALMKKKDEMRKRFEAINQAQLKIKRAQDSEKNTLKALEDLQRERRTYDSKFASASLEHVATVLKMKDAIKEVADCTAAFVKLKLEDFDLMQLERGKKLAVEDLNEQLEAQVKALEKAKIASTEKKDVARAALKKAQEAIGAKEPDSNLQQAFDLHPNDVNEILAAIAAEKAQLDMFADIDEATIEAHQECGKEIVKLKKGQENFDEKYKEMNERIESAKSIWYPKVKEVCAQISSDFTKAFRRLGNAGEVGLREHDSDFSKFGVEIRVCFRGGTKMHLLEGTVQSGGEKSVSTILYLMSLQSLTKCPFRVVDEINQGMDAKNERMIYGQVFHASENTETSQYFIFSQKLLPNLEYKKSMRVLCVINGEYVQDADKMQMSSTHKRTKMSEMIERKLSSDRRLSTPSNRD